VRALLLRLLLKSLQWFFDARIEELRGPALVPISQEVLQRSIEQRTQELLELRLRRLDCYLAVALGNDACQDPYTGQIHRHPNATWIS
jgi:hypothetical protein